MTRLIKRKWIVTAIVLLLVGAVALSGCTSSNNASEGSPSASASSMASVAPATNSAMPETGSTAPTPNPVELSIVGIDISGPVGVQPDDTAKEIARLTGVTMNVTPKNGVDDINTKIATQIASNDLADITFFSNRDLMRSAISAGQLLPLDDLIAKYGQDLQKNVPDMLKYSKTNQSVNKDGKSDGNTYILGGWQVGPVGYDPVNDYVDPAVRYDLFKQLGYPEINSADDYIPLMQEMLALNPKSRDGKKVYGTGLLMNADVSWSTIGNMYGENPWTYTHVNDLSGNFINYVGDPDSSFYKSAKWWNEVNRAGLLDPDSFTMSSDERNSRSNAGRYVFLWKGYRASGYNGESQKAGSQDDYFVALPPLKDITTATWWTPDLPVGNTDWGFAISKKSKHPEEAFKFLNWLASDEGMMVTVNGPQGVAWDYDANGKPHLLPGVYEEWSADPGKNDATKGWVKYSYLSARSDIPVLVLSAETQIPSLNPAAKEMAAHYGGETPSDLLKKQSPTGDIIKVASTISYMPTLPDDLQAKANAVDKYVNDNFVKLILPKTDADYDAAKAKFIAGVEAAGNEEVVKWYQDQDKIAKANLGK